MRLKEIRLHPVSLCKGHLLTALASVLETTATVSRCQGFASTISLPDPRALSERFSRHGGSPPGRQELSPTPRKSPKAAPREKGLSSPRGCPLLTRTGAPEALGESVQTATDQLQRSQRPTGQEAYPKPACLPGNPIQFSAAWA